MSDQVFSLSLPVSITSAAITTLTTLSAPVSIQQFDVREGIYSIDNQYNEYTKPVKIDYASPIKNKLESFKYLDYNWDGYGAETPDVTTLYNSFRFLENLPDYLLAEISTDKIVPTPYGTIVFDFEKNNNLVSVEVGEKNIGFFTEFNDNNNLSLDKTTLNANNLPMEIIEAFNKLYL